MSRAASTFESILLGGEFIQIPPSTEPRKGTLFIEARLKDGLLESGIMTFEGSEEYAKVLGDQLAKSGSTFDMLEDILADEDNAISKLRSEYEKASTILQCLKVVEYVGPATLVSCFEASTVELKVQVFQLYTNESSDGKGNEDGQLGELIPMPHARFEGVWDELVFAHDLKADLVWMMTNILRFSKAFAAHNIRRKLNPLILLHGPPGTGKTSLCLGLAQKISIRLSGTYKSTKLIQVKTAILLSKYFSESAKHVDDIFNRISTMCEYNPEGFVCVLIDEVESIACSREYSTKEGESHDSLRATNALLTGLDRTARYSNVVFLFTSNMCDALEPAFLDRCGLKEFVGPPSKVAQYEILRSSLEKLITCQVVQSAAEIPAYDDATMKATVGAEKSDHPGPKLLEIVKLIHTSTESVGTQISGRSLGQLPEKALMRYLREEECDLDAALRFLRKCVLETLKVGKPNTDSAKSVMEKNVEAKSKKRGWSDASDILDETELDFIHEELKLWDLENELASTPVMKTGEKKPDATDALQTVDETDLNFVDEKLLDSDLDSLDNLESQRDNAPVTETGERKRIFAQFQEDPKDAAATVSEMHPETAGGKPEKKKKM
ncbi:hypothetical protein IFR05_016074 [Cadophora sp. M221]|nr:hypothetical protein IFR05_016074 [Cadophora sp. M221]